MNNNFIAKIQNLNLNFKGKNLFKNLNFDYRNEIRVKNKISLDGIFKKFTFKVFVFTYISVWESHSGILKCSYSKRL